MIVITGHKEYGSHLKYMVFTIFDILKKHFLRVEEIAIGYMIKGSGQAIGFQTIPFRN
jgi:23S rRNA maturation-related 3'-5' exoribonuclease YhaM